MGEQLSNQAGNFNILSQSVWLRVTDCTSIAYLIQQLSYYIIIAVDLLRQQGRAKEVFEDIDDSVDELKESKRILVGTTRTKKEGVRIRYGGYGRWRR